MSTLSGGSPNLLNVILRGYRISWHGVTIFAMQLKRIFLFGVIGSLMVGALIGLIPVFVPNAYGPYRYCFMTMFLIFAASLISMGAGWTFSKDRWGVGMLVAIILAWVGLVLGLSSVWLPIGYPFARNVVNASVGCFAAANGLAIAGLIGLTTFRIVGMMAIRQATILLTLIAAAWICALLIFSTSQNGTAFRVTVALIILAVLGIAVTPFLYLIWGTRTNQPLEFTRLDMKSICPRCLLEQTFPIGDSKCTRCHLRIKIDVEEPRCPQCNYLLYQLTEPRCPECGRRFDAD